MDDDLKYLIHFFCDREHLFKTMTMLESCQFDEVGDKIASQKGWHWGRFSRSDRRDYLQRRLFVEKELYEGYAQEYGHLKEKIPVYFYLYPNITREKAMELGKRRTRFDEIEPQILMLKIEDIDDISNMTFTLNDSFTAFYKKALESGIKCREEEIGRIVLQDHNKVFPFSAIEEVHRKYKTSEMSYEVQIWDYELLEKISYTIIGEGER